MSVYDLLARVPQWPLVTQGKVRRLERNAFDIGVDAGAGGLVRPSEALLAERDDLREVWGE